MTDREELQKQYSYAAMSSKVEMSTVRRERGAPTGEVESLRGRNDIGRMGDRIVPPPPPKKKAKISTSQPEEPVPKRSSSTATMHPTIAIAGETILDLGHDLDHQSYRPSTEHARLAYEQLLGLLSSKDFDLSSMSGSTVLKDAAGEVLRILKDEHGRDPEKHEEISQLLTGKKSIQATRALSKENFAKMVQLAKQMDDYNKSRSGGGTTNENRQAETMNDEMGVAVVFDEEEDQEHSDSDIDQNVVVDSASSSSEDEQDLALDTQGASSDIEKDDEEKQVLLQEKKTSRADRFLSVHEIDAHFLQRQISKHVMQDDADEAAAKAQQVLDILDIRNTSDLRECENKLLVLLGFENFNVIKLILNHRVKVWACVSIKRAQSEAERREIETVLVQHEEGRRVLEEIHAKNMNAQDVAKERLKRLAQSISNKNSSTTVVTSSTDVISTTDSLDVQQGEDAMDVDSSSQPIKGEPIELDLDLLAFRDGAHTMSNKTCQLPDTSWRAMKKGYEEVHVPAIKSVPNKDEKLVQIRELPQWTHVAFKGMDTLNRVQSKLCNVALTTSENILLCAPTGAGKTNVAMLTMLNVLGQYRRGAKELLDSSDVTDDEATGKELFDLSAFKIVYVAPMKALVQEVVKNFDGRLKDYGITVRELSGDVSLTRQQIADTQVIVTTPEKWDIVTRQGEGRAYTQLVKLMIIDEIHLLHDERGPVLESIIARVIRQVEAAAEPIRLVGLSATLPNYTDVATFLRVKPENGLFFFDHSYRPVPLQMQYIGMTERNAFKRFQLQNEICYEKALDQRRERYQMLIFVHSRKECGKTAKALRDLALERDELSYFVRDGSATQEILREEASSAKNADLKDVLPFGFAVHHAGMAREDRELVEDLFDDRHIAVLCCTATLAWGVNLPGEFIIQLPKILFSPSTHFACCYYCCYQPTVL
jgi:pre-mRNA-splicing helicase BRR2